MPSRLVRELFPQRMRDLLRAPPFQQPVLHKGPQLTVTGQLPCPWPGAPLDGQLVRGERTILATGGPITAQLPADRRRRPAQLNGDRVHRVPGPAQVPDAHPLVLTQVTQRDLPAPPIEHSQIVPLPPIRKGDCAPQPPACPGLPVDAHQLTRPTVAHPLRYQLSKLLPLLHVRLWTPPPTPHHNSQTPPVLRRWLESARSDLAPP